MDRRRGRARRVAPWLLIALPLTDVLLGVTHVVPTRVAVVAGLGLEVLLLGVFVAEATTFHAAFRAARLEGASRTDAVLAGVGEALPLPVAFVVRSEVGAVRALWWAVRRRRVAPAGGRVVPYTSRIGVVLWAVLGLGVLEVVVVHVLLPWPVARWVVSGAGVYGLVWLLAFALSLRQRPHSLDGDVLTLRFAHFREVPIPLEHLAGATRGSRMGHRRTFEIASGRLYLSVMGETNVELVFDEPVQVDVGHRLVPVQVVRLFADDDRGLVQALRHRAGRPAE